MSQVTLARFIQPYAQEALNGELGLTSFEIAASLNLFDSAGYVDQHAVKERVGKNLDFMRKNGFHVVTWKSKVAATGRSQNNFVLSVDAAKYIVTSWKSDLGIGYFRFLIECEKIATELTPQLLAELAQLKSELSKVQAQLDAKKVRTLPAPKTVMATKELYSGDSMFGDGVIVKRKMQRVQASSLDTMQILEAKRVMLILQNEGIARRIKDLSNEIDFRKQAALPNQKPLKLL